MIFITTHASTHFPHPHSFTYWPACHTDYQVVRQGQSIHPHEDERKRGGAQGGEDQSGNERVERVVGIERIVFILRVHS